MLALFLLLGASWAQLVVFVAFLRSIFAFCRSIMAARARFSESRTLPGVVFGSRNTWIFDFFPSDEAARSKITLIGGNHKKNCGFRSIELSEKRCKHAFDEPWRQNESRSALYSVPGRPRTRFRTRLGSSWGVRGVPRSALERFLAVQELSRACPDASPTRP